MVKLSKIRTSARQAAARQRIQTIDDPSGSAPPFEVTMPAPGWIFNPGKHEERRLLEDMIAYLQETRPNDVPTLQFLLFDWPQYSHSMNTKTTVLKVKQTLLRLEVDFIHRTHDNYWAYWNDYTETAIDELHPPPDKNDNPNFNSASATTAAVSKKSSNAEADATLDPGDKDSSLDERMSDQSDDHQMASGNSDDSSAASSDQHPREFETPAGSTARSKSSWTKKKSSTEQRTPAVASPWQPMSLSQWTARRQHGMTPQSQRQSKSPSYTAESDASTMEEDDRKPPATIVNPDRHTTAHQQSTRTSDQSTPHSTHSIRLQTPTSDTDDDGFLPVPARKRSKAKPSDKPVLHIDTARQVIDLLTQTQSHQQIIDLLTPHEDTHQASVPPATTPPPPLPVKKKARHSDGADRTMDEAPNPMLSHQVDRRVQALVEAHLAKYKAETAAVEQKQRTYRKQFEKRLTERETLLNRWEITITQRADELTMLERRQMVDLSQREADLAGMARRTQTMLDDHTRQIADITLQNELAFRAWQETEMTTFKANLVLHQTECKAGIEEFCEVQLTHLHSNLENSTEFARGIQDELSARFRSDIQRTSEDAQRDQQAAASNRPIPDAALTPPPEQARQSRTTTTATGETKAEGESFPFSDRHTSDTARPPPPTTTRRWGNVDYGDIMLNSSNAEPPHQVPHPPRQPDAYDGRRGDDMATARRPPQSSHSSKYSDPDYQIEQLRRASTPMHLRGRDRKSVTKFYNSFVDFHKMYRVPIKILDEVRIDRLEDERETLYPAEQYAADPELHDRYSAAIYARLEEDHVLDPSDKLYMGLLQMYNSHRNGYALLKAILAATLMVHSHDLGRLSTPPTAKPGVSPYDFACSLTDFYRAQQQFNRTYTPREQAMMFLQGMANDPDYTMATQQITHDIQQLPEHAPLPPRYCNPALPLTLLAHPSAIHATTKATINVTHGSPHHSARTAGNDTARRQGMDRDRSRSRERRPSSIDPHQRRQQSTPRGSPATRPNMDVQCKACATNGHTHSDCRLFPKIAAILDYVTQHPSEAKDALYQYRKIQHPENRKAARDKVIKVLQGRMLHGQLDTDDDIAYLADQLTGDYWPDTDEQSVSICTIRASQTPHPRDEVTVLSTSRYDAMIGMAHHPVIYPDTHTMDVPRTPRALPPTITDELQRTVPPQYITQTMSRMDTRRDLADTGASVCATGMKEILHDFTSQTSYAIVGYDGVSTHAAGQGTAHIRNSNTNTVDKMLFVYVPSITGTIVSLEHHARTHPRVHRWSQDAIPATSEGWVTFYDSDDKIVSRYPTVQDQGLYYIQDLQFIPAHHSPAPLTVLQGLPATIADDITVKTATIKMWNCVDFDHQLDADNAAFQLRQVQETINPLITDVRTIRLNVTMATPHCTADSGDKMAQAVLHYETWHQRLAHCSEKRMRKTQQLVDGMPGFKTARIPHHVNCRTCDIAKLRKAPRGPTLEADTTMENGQVFSMDIGFIRGPANLAAVLARTEDAEPKVIESRQGFVAYLLIIDNKSRYTWPFPLKSKSVPLTLLRLFLETHGNHTCHNRRIRTDGEGSLAESAACRTLLTELGYRMEKTATDSSSQNGMAERPHQTLAAMVRCLLYSSSLPITFWADALVYATYVNNRLYHSGIDNIPYTAWTGKRANLTHLRAFGAHVTVRKSGHRPTKTDPHHYEGRFLRFGATERNIVYHDTKTKRDKVARHCAIDEFHYGSPSTGRPQGAQQLIHATLPNHVTPSDKPTVTDIGMQDYADPASALGYDDMPDAPQDSLDSLPQFPADRRHQVPDSTLLAAAAQLLGEEAQQEIIHLQPSTDMYATPTLLQIPMNNLPTLGLLTRTDDATHVVYVQGCQEGTKLSRLPRWRSMIKYSAIRAVNDHPIHSKADLIRRITEARVKGDHHVAIRFAKPAVMKLGNEEIPQLHFDQLRHINQMHVALREPVDELTDAFLNFTRAQLRRREDYQEWRDSEWTQHNKYRLQNMFGEPMARPPMSTVLPFVWTYLLKEDPITAELKKKARATCNGGKKYGKAVTVAETYATCVEQPACRLYWAITASECLISMGADAGNAFAEAPPATEPFYMRIDDQFREWWTEHLGNPPIPQGWVLPVNHALQGHPEAPRLWEKHIHGILVNELKFTPTTHEKCLYSRRLPDTPDALQMILRQVDDFAVSASTQAECQEIIKLIGSHLTVPLNDLGIIRKFNGVNIQQTKWFVKVSCEDYIMKILLHHQWQDLKASNIPLPMRSDSKYQRELELATRPTTPQEQHHIQKQAGFSYRMTTGELIYALVVARLDISFAVIKLCQYNANPASIHYQAIKHVFAYLNNTRDDGLIYWRPRPRADLPDVAPPTPRSAPDYRLERPLVHPTVLLAYSDSDWGSDASHRRSVTGIIILLAGAAVLYLTHYQKAVALSSTEAEFVSASEGGKRGIYMRTLLEDLGFTQGTPTTLFIDNTGAVFMVDAGAPTKRTRHVDIRYFALLEWSASGQIKAEAIPTDANISDSMTKATGRIKFHQHADIYMGRDRPHYASENPPRTPTRIHINKFHALSVPLATLSALHHPILSAFTVDTTDSCMIQSMGG